MYTETLFLYNILKKNVRTEVVVYWATTTLNYFEFIYFFKLEKISSVIVLFICKNIIRLQVCMFCTHMRRYTVHVCIPHTNRNDFDWENIRLICSSKQYIGTHLTHNRNTFKEFSRTLKLYFGSEIFKKYFISYLKITIFEKFPLESALVNSHPCKIVTHFQWVGTTGQII